jgi:STAM-binding protein
LQQAQSYERDGNEQDAYLFYLRHALLVMEKLSAHPDLKLPENKDAWKKMGNDLKANMSKMELLKPGIQRRHEEYLQMVAKRREEREQWAQKHQKSAGESGLVDELDQLSLDSSGRRSGQYDYGNRQELDPGENRDLAVKLAHRELRIRGYTSPNDQAKRSSGSWRSRRKRLSGTHDGSDDELSKQIQQVGSRGMQHLNVRSPRDQRQTAARTTSGHRTPHYPTVPKKISNDSSYYGAIPPVASSSQDKTGSYSSSSTLPPSRPPKDYFQARGPPVPEKILTPSPPPYAVEAPDTGIAELDSRDYSFKPTAFTENGAPLRTVFINPKLRNRFLTIALPNTERNLETCGILCGTLISNAFFISKLVIPEQESTSDTCDTVNEGALFDYCDSENLMTLGWIHTHPTQTCFMSSRDLHTHGGYQVQLAESIAIVCAPRRDPSYRLPALLSVAAANVSLLRWGVFRLTDPPGLKTILNCRQTGLFHPHGEDNVYTDALKPGHVWELPLLDFDVVDLRPGNSWL